MRSIITTVLPLLRANNIRLYDWSPAAAGFFATRHRQTTDSRIGAHLRSIYDDAAVPSFPRALAAFHAALTQSEDPRVSGHEVALRWLRYHSALDGGKGDAIVFGAGTEARIEALLGGV